MRKSSLSSRCSLLITIGFVGITLGCGSFRNVTPPPAPCSIEDLLIDESVVPNEWYLSTSGDPATRFGVEFQSMIFTSQYGGGIYDIYRERSIRNARDGYRGLVKSYFSPRAKFTEWELPPEIMYQSSTADQAQLGCATDIFSKVQHCQFVAQYNVYIVWFDADMSEVMTYADFEAVLQEIDRRMTECLSP